MAEKWRQYETMMIFDPGLGPEATEELVQKAREYVTQASGRLLKTERWGTRDLAYELKGRSKGYYLLLEYAGLPQVSGEIARRLNLLDTVVKFQTVKLKDAVDPDSLPEPVEIMAPAAVQPPPAPAPEAEAEESEEGAGEETEAPAEE